MALQDEEAEKRFKEYHAIDGSVAMCRVFQLFAVVIGVQVTLVAATLGDFIVVLASALIGVAAIWGFQLRVRGMKARKRQIRSRISEEDFRALTREAAEREAETAIYSTRRCSLCGEMADMRHHRHEGYSL